MTSKGKFTPKELVGKILIHFLTITDELGKKFSDLFQPPGAMFSALVEPAPSLSSQHVDPGLLISRPRKPGKWNFGPPWQSPFYKLFFLVLLYWCFRWFTFSIISILLWKLQISVAPPEISIFSFVHKIIEHTNFFRKITRIKFFWTVVSTKSTSLCMIMLLFGDFLNSTTWCLTKFFLGVFLFCCVRSIHSSAFYIFFFFVCFGVTNNSRS